MYHNGDYTRYRQDLGTTTYIGAVESRKGFIIRRAGVTGTRPFCAKTGYMYVLHLSPAHYHPHELPSRSV